MMNSQKILILTDLHWDKASKDITSDEVVLVKTHNIIPDKTSFSKIKDYIQIIKAHCPDLILFGGDVTGDGSCGHGYHYAFICLLQYLENCNINSVFIKGNHDVDEYYNKVIEVCSQFKFSQEISGKYVEINGIKIVGLSFEDTCDKAKVKKLLSIKNTVDIVLAHSELARRLWLFDFDSQYIITGHYDYKFSHVNKKIFLSFFNDSPYLNYGLIDINKHKEIISYFLDSNSFEQILITGERNNDEFAYTSIEKTLIPESVPRGHVLFDIMNPEFKRGVERILKAKSNFYLLNTKLTQSELSEIVTLKVNSSMKFSKTMILDYLGSSLIEK